jgi:hypothetical protein
MATLRIAPVTVELDRDRILSTIGYNGTAPGPVLRMKEGKPVTVEVINDTDTPELVHWHGMLIPPRSTGTKRKARPFVPPHGSRRFSSPHRPPARRWYHSHAMAMDDLHKGAYTGQFGFVYVEPVTNPGATIRNSSSPARLGAVLSPAPWSTWTTTTTPTAPCWRSRPFSTPPQRPRSQLHHLLHQRQGARRRRAHPRLARASAALPLPQRQRHREPPHRPRRPQDEGDRARRQPRPAPQSLDSIFLGAGERIDAEIEMNNPGVWVLGATKRPSANRVWALSSSTRISTIRRNGSTRRRTRWDYTVFGRANSALTRAASRPSN